MTNQTQNRQSNIHSYYTNNIIHQPQNLGDLSGSLNFRPQNHFSQVKVIDVESIIIKKLDKKLNKCENGTSF